MGTGSVGEAQNVHYTAAQLKWAASYKPRTKVYTSKGF